MHNLYVIILLFFMITFCNSEVFARHFSYMASQDPKLKDLFFKGVDYIDNKKYDEAIKVLEEALKINPKQMQVMGELCYSYSQKERYDEMLKYAKKGLLIAQQQLSKDNIGRFYGYIGNAYKMQEKYDEAIKNLQLAIHNKPYFYDNYLSLAYCYYKTERYSSALNTYDLIKNQDKEYYETNNLEKSRELIFNKALENDYAIKHLELGFKYRSEKNYAAAINEYKKILDKEPDDITSLTELIINHSLNDSGNYDEIISLCKKALIIIDKKENKNNYEALESIYNGLCFSYQKQNNTKLYSEYKKLNESLSILKKAEEELANGNLNKSIKKYEEAIETISDLEEAKYNYAALDGLIGLSLNIGEYETAKKYISIGLKISEKEKNIIKSAKYLKDMATYYALQNKYEEAKTYYEKGLEKTTDLDDKFKFTMGLALCYSVLGNIREELNCYEKCKGYLRDDAVEMISDIDSSIVRCKSLLDASSDLSKGLKYFSNGEEFVEKEKYEQAVDEFANSLKHLPQRLETLKELSICLNKLKKEEEANEVDNEGFLISTRDKDAFYIDFFAICLANYNYLNKNYKKAIYYYRFVSEDNTNFKQKDVLYLIGTCYMLSNENNEAVKYYEAAHELDPSDEEISEQLELCRELLKK